MCTQHKCRISDNNGGRILPHHKDLFPGNATIPNCRTCTKERYFSLHNLLKPLQFFAFDLTFMDMARLHQSCAILPFYLDYCSESTFTLQLHTWYITSKSRPNKLQLQTSFKIIPDTACKDAFNSPTEASFLYRAAESMCL